MTNGYIDHFKKVNDTFGHIAGDAAILHVVHRIRAALSDGGQFGRFGGEEFVIYLVQESNESKKDSAFEQLAERVRRAVEENPLNYDGQVIPLTVSAGVTTHRTGEEPGETLNRADQALYQAKGSGRNQVQTL